MCSLEKQAVRPPGKLANVYHLMAAPSGGQGGAPQHKQRAAVRSGWVVFCGRLAWVGCSCGTRFNFFGGLVR
ncbi:hypothetical protein EDI28_24800 [Photobacterium chitinilyticum]|uniref:Uncharacterized protein n=1 Tax=Photobacterium chitinilyticum TaxID=2485123 RepID=A0A3S3QPX2_9GAMM|nr:hypothetical protein EDI28_24800 [Photobacterium chitinilyticum]